jgi:hypothetical protein
MRVSCVRACAHTQARDLLALALTPSPSSQRPSWNAKRRVNAVLALE